MACTKIIGKNFKKININNLPQDQQIKRSVEREMDRLLEQEEIDWRQRSRINWLKDGDRNTKFFHHKATWRAKTNKIGRLQRSNGSMTTDKTEMETMTTDFFQKSLYS